MRCEACQRELPEQVMTRHHLRTRKVDPDAVAWLCGPCHKFVHRLYTNKQLAQRCDLSTVEALLGQPEFAKAVAWIAKQPAGASIKVYSPRSRKRR